MSRTEPAATPLGDAFHVFDTTLRDGAQREGISYSVADKLAVARHLDALGVGFIEGGWPGALPKDTEFFARAAAGELELQHAALVAFGATRKAGTSAAEDPQVLALLASRGAGRHARREVRPAAHRAGAAHRRGRELRDGRRHGRVPPRRGPPGVPRRRALLRRLRLRPRHRAARADAAVTAGADVAVLCDTNGGMLPLGVAEVVDGGGRAHRLPARHPLPGRHGLRGRQLGGRGTSGRDARPVHRERLWRTGGQRRPVRRRGESRDQAGDARPTGRRLGELTRTSHALAEIANIAPDTHQAYVGT